MESEARARSPRAAGTAALNAQWVMQAATEHLEAAADGDEFAAVAQMTIQMAAPALTTQPVEVRAHRLRGG